MSYMRLLLPTCGRVIIAHRRRSGTVSLAPGHAIATATLLSCLPCLIASLGLFCWQLRCRRAGQVCAIDEMICYMLAKKLGPLRQFREYFTQFGGMTGGTVATNIATLQGTTPDACRILSDPFFLGGPHCAIATLAATVLLQTRGSVEQSFPVCPAGPFPS